MEGESHLIKSLLSRVKWEGTGTDCTAITINMGIGDGGTIEGLQAKASRREVLMEGHYGISSIPGVISTRGVARGEGAFIHHLTSIFLWSMSMSRWMVLDGILADRDFIWEV